MAIRLHFWENMLPPGRDLTPWREVPARLAGRVYRRADRLERRLAVFFGGIEF